MMTNKPAVSSSPLAHRQMTGSRTATDQLLSPAAAPNTPHCELASLPSDTRVACRDDSIWT